MEQMALSNMTQDERGELIAAPEWMKEERCENCSFWTWLPKKPGQSDGWGIKGACSRHRGQETGKSDYCQSFTNKWE